MVTLGVLGVPHGPINPRRLQQQHKDQADVDAEMLGRATQKPHKQARGSWVPAPRWPHPSTKHPMAPHHPPSILTAAMQPPQTIRRIQRGAGAPSPSKPTPWWCFGPSRCDAGEGGTPGRQWGGTLPLVCPDLHHKRPILANLGDLPTPAARGVNGFSLPRPSCHFD